MSLRFHVLASGSAGNASVLETAGVGVLIDFGLSIRTLTTRLKRASLTWEQIHAVVLTHTHGDHWQPETLAHLAELRRPLYCHPDHGKILERESDVYSELVATGFVRFYEPGQSLNLHPACQCVPIALEHDAPMTCGFRFDGPPVLLGSSWALGYASDLGCWSGDLAKQFSDVDVLAIEFNHDVALQINSGRHPTLIRRVLSDQGHLSNVQAAALCDAILEASEPGRLKSLIQLHLSHECNRPELARSEAEQLLEQRGISVAIHTARQNHTGPAIGLDASAPSRRRRARRAVPKFVQPFLRFVEEEASQA